MSVPNHSNGWMQLAMTGNGHRIAVNDRVDGRGTI